TRGQQQSEPQHVRSAEISGQQQSEPQHVRSADNSNRNLNMYGVLQKYGTVATNFLFIIGAKFQFTEIEQGFLTKRRMVQVGSRYIYNMFKKWRNNTMREKAIRINILALIAFILISSFALPVGTSHAASTTFINDIAEKYEALEDEFT